MSAPVSKKSESSAIKHSFKSYTKKAVKKTKPHFETAATAYTILSATQLFTGSSSWFASLPFAVEVQTGVALIPSAVEIISAPSSIQTIIKNLKKKGLKGADKVERDLVILSKTIRLGCAILSAIKITETIGLPILGLVARSLGNGAPAIKIALTSAPPFMIVYSSFQIAKSLAEIGIDCVHIYQANKKMKRIREKRSSWEAVQWTSPKGTQFAKEKADRLEQKHNTTSLQLDEMTTILTDSCALMQKKELKASRKKIELNQKKASLAHRTYLVRLFGKTVPNFQLAKARAKYKTALKDHRIILEEYNNLSALSNLRSRQIKGWRSIETKSKTGQITTYDQVALNRLKKQKLAKLDTKKNNLRIVKLKTYASIFLKALVISSLVASIILTFVPGSAAFPGLLTTALLMILVALGEYGLKRLKRSKKTISHSPVLIPNLA